MEIDGLLRQLTMPLVGLSLNLFQQQRKMLLLSSSNEIYLHYGAPQEILTDGGKNLWGGVVQKYLEKIKTLHKGTRPYHPRRNGKVERLNGVIGSLLGKMLLNKPTKLWDLYVDQAIFACRI